MSFDKKSLTDIEQFLRDNLNELQSENELEVRFYENILAEIKSIPTLTKDNFDFIKNYVETFGKTVGLQGPYLSTTTKEETTPDKSTTQVIRIITDEQNNIKTYQNKTSSSYKTKQDDIRNLIIKSTLSKEENLDQNDKRVQNIKLKKIQIQHNKTLTRHRTSYKLQAQGSDYIYSIDMTVVRDSQYKEYYQVELDITKPDNKQTTDINVEIEQCLQIFNFLDDGFQLFKSIKWSQHTRPKNFQPFVQHRMFNDTMFVTNKLNGQAVDILLINNKLIVYKQNKQADKQKEEEIIKWMYLENNSLSQYTNKQFTFHGEHYGDKVYLYGMKNNNKYSTFSKVIELLHDVFNGSDYFHVKDFRKIENQQTVQDYYNDLEKTYGKQLEDVNDGIIFQPNDYINLSVLKWKFAKHITVDLKVKQRNQGLDGIWDLFARGKNDQLIQVDPNHPLIQDKVDNEEGKQIEIKDGMVLELGYENERYKAYKQRNKQANYIKVYDETMYDVKYPISFKELVGFLAKIYAKESLYSCDIFVNDMIKSTKHNIQQDLVSLIEKQNVTKNPQPTILLCPSDLIDKSVLLSMNNVDQYPLQQEDKKYDMIISINITQSHLPFTELQKILAKHSQVDTKFIFGTLSDSILNNYMFGFSSYAVKSVVNQLNDTKTLYLKFDEHTGLQSNENLNLISIDSILQLGSNHNFYVEKYQFMELLGSHDNNIRKFMTNFRFIVMKKKDHTESIIKKLETYPIQPIFGQYIEYGVTQKKPVSEPLFSITLNDKTKIVEYEDHNYLVDNNKVDLFYQMFDFNDLRMVSIYKN